MKEVVITTSTLAETMQVSQVKIIRWLITKDSVMESPERML